MDGKKESPQPNLNSLQVLPPECEIAFRLLWSKLSAQ